jgi:tetratricopeptide (TPR) repeat protein
MADRAWLLYQQSRYEEAIEEAGRALQEDPEDYWSMSITALSLARLGRFKSALETIDAAIALAPEEEWMYYRRAVILQRADRYKEGLEAVEDSLRQDPEFYNAVTLKAELLGDIGKEKEALQVAKDAIQLNPEYAWARRVYARLLRKQGESEKAKEEFDFLLRDEPENSWLHAQRGWASLETGDIDGAMPYFQESLRLKPNKNRFAVRGLFQCLKARHPIYRPYLRYEMLISRNPWIAQLVAVLVVALFAGGWRLMTDEVPLWVQIPIHLVFMFAVAAIYLGWVGRPAFNVLLLLDGVARHAMRPWEKTAGVLFTLSLVLAVVFFLANLTVGQPIAAWLVYVSGLTLASPLWGAVSMNKRWTTWAAGASALLVASFFVTAGVVSLTSVEDNEILGMLLAMVAMLAALKNRWVILFLRAAD